MNNKMEILIPAIIEWWN